MVGPAAKRAAVAHLQAVMSLSERRACSIVVSTRARPRTGAHRFHRLRSSGSSLCILMSCVRFSMPKSVNAMTWSSPMP